MDNITLLLIVIIAFVVAGWLYQAWRIYPDYKNSIYGDLYGGFLPYFWRTVIISDASESPFLKDAVGKSYILFSKMSNNGSTMGRFCSVFYNKGIMVLCYEGVNGVIKGKLNDSHWIVTRTDAKTGESKTFRHESSYKALATYLKKVKETFPDVNIETRMAFGDKTDFTKLKSDVKCIHFGEVIQEMKDVKADFLSDDEVKELFLKASGRKR